MKKISSLPGESPSRSPSTLCLRSDLLSASLHASSLSSASSLSASLSHSSLSSDLASDSSLSPVSLPSVLGVISSQNFQRKPGQVANLSPATLTCPDSRRCPGQRTPFAPPLGEGLLLPQPPQQTSPMAGLGGSGKPLLTSPRTGSGGSWKPSATATRSTSPPTETFTIFGEGPVLQPPQTSPMLGLSGSSKSPLTSSRAGSGGRRKASETVMRPASLESEAREKTTASLPVCSAPTVVPPVAVTAKNSSEVSRDLYPFLFNPMALRQSEGHFLWESQQKGSNSAQVLHILYKTNNNKLVFTYLYFVYGWKKSQNIVLQE